MMSIFQKFLVFFKIFWQFLWQILVLAKLFGSFDHDWPIQSGNNSGDKFSVEIDFTNFYIFDLKIRKNSCEKLESLAILGGLASIFKGYPVLTPLIPFELRTLCVISFMLANLERRILIEKL